MATAVPRQNPTLFARSFRKTNQTLSLDYGFCELALRLVAGPAGIAFSFSRAGCLYGVFSEAASVNAALASGIFLRLTNAKPSRYWLRAQLTSLDLSSGA